jgi:hypothetical protein
MPLIHPLESKVVLSRYVQLDLWTSAPADYLSTYPGWSAFSALLFSDYINSGEA